MPITKSPYVYGFEVKHIHNRNEQRVRDALNEALAQTKGICLCEMCIEDIYALTLNSLPAHYVQQRSIILEQKPSDEEVMEAGLHAIQVVGKKPNHEK